jgi:hypothetical protein
MNVTVPRGVGDCRVNAQQAYPVVRRAMQLYELGDSNLLAARSLLNERRSPS